MLLKSNLRLLLAQLDGLAETPYFSSDLDNYINELRKALSELLSRLEHRSPKIDQNIAQYIARGVWRLTQFLTGSTAKQIPYEVVFAIENAANDWGIKKLLITTAIIQEGNFYFHGGNQSIFNLIEKELGIKISYQPVQIALPYIYRHKPLFCVPLFHELGHFFDTNNKIIETSLLHSPASIGPDLPGCLISSEIAKLSGREGEYHKSVVMRHRKEYFADLVSVAYVGKAMPGFIEEFCPDNPKGDSHPSSAARLKVMMDFMNGIDNPIVNLFQESLSLRGFQPITKRFNSVVIDDAFGNVRPCQLNSDKDVFGIFESGWIFLQKTIINRSGLWEKLSEAEIERITNDLTEKSIRNRMILEGWHATTDL